MEMIQARRAKCALVIMTALVVVTWIQPVGAAQASLRVAYPAPTASFLPLWAAHDAGFF
jgi:hypothetical protein